jgi:hypothetical protein
MKTEVLDMEFNDFITLEFVLSFTGMVIVVSLLTQFTKKLFDKLFDNRTKYVAYAWSFVLSVFAAICTGSFSTAIEIFETCLIWFINSALVWFTAMKAFEEVKNFNN